MSSEQHLHRQFTPKFCTVIRARKTFSEKYQHYLKFVLQLSQILLQNLRRVSEDACDLMDGEETFLSEQSGHHVYPLDWQEHDLGVVTDHPLQTTCGQISDNPPSVAFKLGSMENFREGEQ